MEIGKAFTDPALEKGGVWVRLSEARPEGGYDDGEVKVARFNNLRFRREIQELRRPYMGEELDPDVEDELMATAIARTILLDWRNFTKDGKPLPYSREDAIKLLTLHGDFMQDVTLLASRRALFKNKSDKETEKNS